MCVRKQQEKKNKYIFYTSTFCMERSCLTVLFYYTSFTIKSDSSQVQLV